MTIDPRVQINDLNIVVNRDLCYACGICVERCILDNLALSVAPCRQACPIKMNCQGYIRLLAQGKEKEAAQEMRQGSPFAGILGRVCHHPCEGDCERTNVDAAVQIKAIKRYLADTLPQISLSVPEMPQETRHRIAVVGSGPAGLSAAYELRALGHQVTVFESQSEPGGLLRYGIPSFRLPVEEVEKAVALMERMLIGFKTGHALGKQLSLDDLKEQYDALLVAVGASQPVEYPVRSDIEILEGLDLLKTAKEGRTCKLGNRVGVIGGGNSAVDAALVSRRMGADEVTIVCLESAQEMPSFPAEIQQALEEGISIRNSSGIIGINNRGDGSLGLELADCLSLVDEKGHFNPKLSTECAAELTVDSIVAAIGQRVDADRLPGSLLDSRTERLAADPLTGQHPTDLKVFSCGDCVNGPSSVVDALAAGKEAAISIDRFVRGDGLHWGRGFWNTAYRKEYLALPERADGQPPMAIPRVAPSERRLSQEVERIFSQTDAVKEAARCISCGRAFELNNTCWSCLPCEIECPTQALEVKMPYLLR